MLMRCYTGLPLPPLLASRNSGVPCYQGYRPATRKCNNAASLKTLRKTLPYCTYFILSPVVLLAHPALLVVGGVTLTRSRSY